MVIVVDPPSPLNMHISARIDDKWYSWEYCASSLRKIFTSGKNLHGKLFNNLEKLINTANSVKTLFVVQSNQYLMKE